MLLNEDVPGQTTSHTQGKKTTTGEDAAALAAVVLGLLF